jgi:maltooligosyltrehalose trehalohydrolase
LPPPDTYAWAQGDWPGRPWREAVLYEAHCGVLGGFNEVAKRLPELAKLGVTALQLMPVNAFSGERNWGYDGVLPYAIAPPTVRPMSSRRWSMPPMAWA